MNRTVILELREDINALEIQIQKFDIHITELIRENEGLKRTCHKRDKKAAILITRNLQKNAAQCEVNKERMNQVFSSLLRLKP